MMALRPWVWMGVACCCAALQWGCAPTVAGSFEPTMYRHATYDYSVPYRSSTLADVLGSDWNLDNFYERNGKLEPKRGADYEAKVYVDVDGDGDADNLGKVYVYDLRFTHKQSSGVVWLRTLLIEKQLESKDLRVLMRDYVAAMAGTHYEAVQLQGELVRVAQERTYGIEELSADAGRVAGHPAYRTDMHVVDVDQHQIAPNSRAHKVRLVMVKTPFRWVQPSEDLTKPGYELPVIMLIGYAAHADDFDAGLPDYEGLIQRITLAGKHGAKFESTKATKALATSASPAPEPRPASPEATDPVVAEPPPAPSDPASAITPP